MWPWTSSKRSSAESALQKKRATGNHRALDADHHVRWLDSLLFIVFALLVSAICFLGLSPLGPDLREGQIARTRIVAERDFNYISHIDTEAIKEERRRQVPPVFRIDLEPYEAFASHLRQLMQDLSSYVRVPEGMDPVPVKAEEVERFLDSYPPDNPFGINAEALATFINAIPEQRRAEVLDEALFILNSILSQGVHDANESEFASGGLSFLEIQGGTEGIDVANLLTYEEALRALRINLIALDVPRLGAAALAQMLNPALAPNLRFDEEQSQLAVNRALAAIEPVIRNVRAGDTIIEPQSRITPRDFEQLAAYRELLQQANTDELAAGHQFIEKALLSVTAILGGLIYLQLTHSRLLRERRLVILTGLLLLFNLGVLRLLLELGTGPIGQNNPGLVSVLPFLLPVAFGPMLVSILAGAGPALLSAALIAFLAAMMQGNSYVYLVTALTSGLVGVYYCRNIQLRARVVRAGLFSGLVLAAGAGFEGVRDAADVTTVLYQMIAGTGTGLLTGVLVVGMLPIWESLFRHTSDITLLELTDFNHPLLRRMQIEAPGSYHHSLMVANLAENAAARLGANALLCRVCSLFHDIGKIIKPEYFIENQRDGLNPHLDRNPSISALVIKSHVKEGVQMARQAKLPRVIIEVIRQHHGTGLIQYFFRKAMEERERAIEEAQHRGLPPVDIDEVKEETYRYEGPKPQFLESAIIMLADSVEAASRSLKKVSPQSIDELITNILEDRRQDGQLDETAITLQQLALIRESFGFTLLNMLHARVVYPERPDKKKKKGPEKAEDVPASAPDDAPPTPPAFGLTPPDEPAAEPPRPPERATRR